MEKIDKIINGAITAVLALAVGTAVTTTVCAAPASETPAQPEMEKCYGIAKAQKNDCKTSKASCAGSAHQDNQPDAFLLVPKGLCDKIVGGKLEEPHSTTEKK